jgi:hypothetical protein
MILVSVLVMVVIVYVSAGHGTEVAGLASLLHAPEVSAAVAAATPGSEVSARVRCFRHHREPQVGGRVLTREREIAGPPHYGARLVAVTPTAWGA